MAQTKIRFDGKGSEFGLIHRELPIEYGMFDIDKMKASALVDLELKKEDIGFLEYRTNWRNSTITWKALFEIKYRNSANVQDAINCKMGTATWAQLKLCHTLGCRYFMVIATNGKQPFVFYEIHDTGDFEIKGTLDYFDRHTDGKENIKEFWCNVLKL